MSFDRDALICACRSHGRVARVVVASVRGSAPREVGAAMLVWSDGFSGTIGGGALEHQSIKTARSALERAGRLISRHALGPDLGQCCGGSVDLLTEVYDLAAAEALPEDLILRGDADMPLAVARLKAEFERTGHAPAPQQISGWMVEPVTTPQRQLWIWGAGHVGRALIGVMAPLPDLLVTWVDTHTSRFPGDVPPNVDTIAAAHPAKLAAYCPRDAEHILVTYSHDLDLELCHQLLRRGFRSAGLIGSATKWARFQSRLSALGHSRESIAAITCPIGAPSLGKHPHAIAIGVAQDFIAAAAEPLRLKGTA